MKATKQTPLAHPQSKPALRAPTLEPTLEQICQRANIIYVARHGVEGLDLNDWLAAEQQLQREWGLRTDHP
jgi:hypothetical protein